MKRSVLEYNQYDYLQYESLVCHFWLILSGICNQCLELIESGILNGSSVTMARWRPGSGDIFMASFDDGSVLNFNKVINDQTFIHLEPQLWTNELLYLYVWC